MRQSDIPAHHKAYAICRHDRDPAKACEIIVRPTPIPRPNEALVKNRYAGVNAIYDYGLICGAIQRDDAVLPTPFGFESLGEVVAVGERADLHVGDVVVSNRFGCGYAEYFSASAEDLVRVPAMDPRFLALWPTGISAWIALHRTGAMTEGENVFVSAGAGGFGHIAVQLAHHANNRVVTTCSSEAKAQRLRRLGVDVVNYRDVDLAAVLPQYFPDGIDLVLDTVGGAVFDTLVANLANHGRLVSAGFSSDTPNPQPVLASRIYAELYWKSASVRAFMNPLHKSEHPLALATLINLLDRDELEVWLHKPSFKGLESITEAISCLRSGANIGKVMIEFSN